MKAKDFLNQLKKLDKLIENKLVERDQWFAMATSTTAASAPETGIRVQSSGSKQQMANAADRYIDIKDEIDGMIDRLCDERKKIIAIIEQLDVVEYDVLHKRYVGIMQNGRRHYCEFIEIGEMYNRSKSWATTMHGIALKHVQKIIDDCSIL